MADYHVEFRWQERGGTVWTGRSEKFTLPTENPSAQDFRTLLMGKNPRYADVRIVSVEYTGVLKSYLLYFEKN